MTLEFDTTQLVARIHAGDRAAETELAQRFWAGLVLLMEMRTRDPELARDLAQEACLAAIVKLRDKPIDDPAKLKAYLRKTAIYLFNNHWRKETRRATAFDTDAVEHHADETADAPGTLLAAESREAVRALIERIGNDRYRELLRRRYVEDEAKPRTCEALGIKSRDYDRAISRARAAFRQLVERSGARLGIDCTFQST
ncbi:MAG: sigma factor [Pseudomonadota bacterium]